MGLAELTRSAVHVLPEGELERKLALGRPLRVKLGIDPTAPDLHLGSAVPLLEMAAFQREGHVGVLIIGDYTGRIGDPSGRSKERPVLPDEVIDANARTYQEQAFKILDPERTEVRFNSEWLAKLDFAEVLRITRTMTVARLLEREDFAKRMEAKAPISVSELLYPLMQGYDSVAIEADVELGGTEQLYNLLAGRDVMEAYGLEPQVALTLPILPGTDGVERMAKSRGNYVGIAEPPEEQFGKVMSIPDSVLPDYWRLCLEQEPPELEPLESKLALARGIVERYHGPDAVGPAEEHFTRVVREGRAPEEMREVTITSSNGRIYLPGLLADAFGQSNSHWRRVIEQGGVKINGDVVRELELSVDALDGAVVQAGKRQFLRFRAA
jgi:tyrosyl-tRNA synthetase